LAQEVPRELKTRGVAAGPSRLASRPRNVDGYLKLVDWTGRRVRLNKRGAIPADLAPIVDRLQVTGEV
jgi:hypothetical protein